MKTARILRVATLSLLPPAFAADPPAPAAAPVPPPAPAAIAPARPPPLPVSKVASPARTTDNVEFVIGPDYAYAPELTPRDNVPKGKVYEFTMNSADSKIYPGIAKGKTGVVPYQRKVWVYVPNQYAAGTPAPFIVAQDNYGKDFLPTILDNMIADQRLPVMVAVMVANGGGDAQGSERGKEYDTMSGAYADYIETEVLPRVEKNCDVKLTKDPDGRATMGNSSGGSAALIMAWYRPELYHRVLTTSGTFVNQQWPFNPETPGGAWDFHTTLIPNSPKKPLRIFLSVGDKDLLNPNVMRDDMHDWVEANHRMAKVLKDKGYPYQYLFCRNSGHGVGNAQAQFLPHALEWVWQGYGKEQGK